VDVDLGMVGSGGEVKGLGHVIGIKQSQKQLVDRLTLPKVKLRLGEITLAKASLG